MFQRHCRHRQRLALSGRQAVQLFFCVLLIGTEPTAAQDKAPAASTDKPYTVVDGYKVDSKTMSAEVDFSISENTNFRFYFVPDGGGQLEAKVVDNQDLEFVTTVSLDTASALR